MNCELAITTSSPSPSTSSTSNFLLIPSPPPATPTLLSIFDNDDDDEQAYLDDMASSSNLVSDPCDTIPTPRHIRLPGRSTSRSPSPIPSPGSNTPTLFDIVTAEDVDSANVDSDSDERAAVTDAKGESLAHALAAGPPSKEAFTTNPQPEAPVQPQPPARKLCVRHQRMADEGTNMNLQKSLDALSLEDREVVNTVWSNFSSSPHSRREVIIKGLLTMCCFSQLSMVSNELQSIIRIDPFTVLPREIAIKILGYLDAITLCRAAQVNKAWSRLADDDVLWRNICEQHIGQKCKKCGWGLPMLERKRMIKVPPTPPPEGAPSTFFKRVLENTPCGSSRPLKRMRSETSTNVTTPSDGGISAEPSDLSDSAISKLPPSPRMITRPWKDVYSERLTIERNWRRGRCSVRVLKGHTDGVMCLQFSETLHHPAFPVLITGSYDRTVRVWNMETGTEIRCLSGHARGVRALQFDEAKLITGSMDRTMRVWNWRTGKCIRVLEGHTDGIVCLNFDSTLLASGSVDRTVKIWNFRTGECFTLRGHRDWVNSVKLWDSTQRPEECTGMTPIESTSTCNNFNSQIDPGKMLFSGSDDGTIILWDLARRAIVRTFTGHVGQVQSVNIVYDNVPCSDDEADNAQSPIDRRSTLPSGLPGFAPASVSLPSPPHPEHPGFDDPAFDAPHGFDPFAYRSSPHSQPNVGVYAPGSSSNSKGKVKVKVNSKRDSKSPSASVVTKPKPVLISGSLDNTIRVWDVETGKALTTLFGHIEGVWAVATDRLRLVSASHDRTIKVWMREENRCMATLVGHRGAVTCLALGDDKIVSGSDDNDIRIWNFAE